MSKFAVGDKVEILWTRSPQEAVSIARVGTYGNVAAIGNFKAGSRLPNGDILKKDSKYCVRFEDGIFGGYLESQLRKLPGDDQSDCIPAVTRQLFTKRQRNPDDVPAKERV